MSGNLKGIFIDSELSFATLDAAREYVNFLNNHKTIPVDPCVGDSEYLCHMAGLSLEENK